MREVGVPIYIEHVGKGAFRFYIGCPKMSRIILDLNRHNTHCDTFIYHNSITITVEQFSQCAEFYFPRFRWEYLTIKID